MASWLLAALAGGPISWAPPVVIPPRSALPARLPCEAGARCFL